MTQRRSALFPLAVCFSLALLAVVGWFLRSGHLPRLVIPHDLFLVLGLLLLGGMGFVLFCEHHEVELKASEARLKAVTAHIPGMVFQAVRTPDGHGLRYLFVSAGASEIFGIAPEKITSEDGQVLRRIHPADVERVRGAVAASAEKMQRWNFEFRIVRPDGTFRWLRSTAQPRPDSSGDILWDGLCQDITDTREVEAALRESEERYALAVQAAGEGLWQWNTLTGELYLSPRLAALIGIALPSPETALAVYESHIHPEDRTRRQEAIRRHLSGHTASFFCEYRLRSADGTYLWVLDRGLVQRDRQGWGYRMAGSVGDVTERKSFEATLRTAKEEAESASRAKSEFLANMSHELRTPLNAIIGFASVIDEQLLGADRQDKYREYARDIKSSGEHLLAVINNILDVAKIEAGKMELQESLVNPAEVAEQAIRLVAERASRGGITLACTAEPDLPPLRADRHKLMQILLNLLSNAVKFTPAGGTVRLILAREGGGGLAIAVEDSGIGISPADLPKALEPFGQIDSALNRRFEGTGLGLALVQSLARLHGARLTLASSPGFGTIATVIFPPARCAIADDSAQRL